METLAVVHTPHTGARVLHTGHVSLSRNQGVRQCVWNRWPHGSKGDTFASGFQPSRQIAHVSPPMPLGHRAQTKGSHSAHRQTCKHTRAQNAVYLSVSSRVSNRITWGRSRSNRMMDTSDVGPAPQDITHNNAHRGNDCVAIAQMSVCVCERERERVNAHLRR